MVVNLVKTYRTIKPNYSYKEEEKPLNLTEPSEGVNNNGKDNEEFNLIVYQNEEIKSPKTVYKVTKLLGQGISGQVFEAFSESDGEGYALKVIRNRPAYLKQAKIELQLLQLLNNEIDKNDQYHIIRIHDSFMYYDHLCFVFELLKANLYEFLQHNHLQGVALCSIRFVTRQILEAVEKLHRAQIIHCDLKPENILLVKDNKNSVKVVDFGSSCFDKEIIYSYIQSRFYRAPEVLLGQNYSVQIDMWSLGCILCELFTGVPIFPGENERDQLNYIMEYIDIPPSEYINMSSKKDVFFDKNGYPFKIPNSNGKIRIPNTKTFQYFLKGSGDFFIDFIQFFFLLGFSYLYKLKYNLFG